MRASLSSVPQEVQELFARTFDAGLDADARPSPPEWRSALAAIQQPPKIEFISVDENVVIEGDCVVVTWRARNASFVEISPGGRQQARGCMSLMPAQTTRIAITAYNPYGSDTATGPAVRVVRLPRIEVVPVPACTDLPAFPTSSMPRFQMTGFKMEALRVFPSPVFRRTSLGHEWDGPLPRFPGLPDLPQIPPLRNPKS